MTDAHDNLQASLDAMSERFLRARLNYTHFLGRLQDAELLITNYMIFHRTTVVPPGLEAERAAAQKVADAWRKKAQEVLGEIEDVDPVYAGEVRFHRGVVWP